MSQFDCSYAQPTVFDQLWSHLCRATRPLLRNNETLWGVTFSLLGAAFYIGGAVALVAALQPGTVTEVMVARLGVFVAGGAAGRHFLLTGLGLLASEFPLAGQLVEPRKAPVQATPPAPARDAVPVTVQTEAPAAVVKARVAPSMAERREFLVLVRKAGVNVRIAQALVGARLDCRAAVQAASDAEVLAVHGVGRATLGRLRLQFPARASVESAVAPVGLGQRVHGRVDGL